MGTICNQTDRREFNAAFGKERITLIEMWERVQALYTDTGRAKPSADAMLAAAVELYKTEYQIDDYDRQDENICGIYEAMTAIAAGMSEIAASIDRLGDKVGDLEDDGGIAKALQNIAFVVDDNKTFSHPPADDF